LHSKSKQTHPKSKRKTSWLPPCTC